MKFQKNELIYANSLNKTVYLILENFLSNAISKIFILLLLVGCADSSSNEKEESVETVLDDQKIEVTVDTLKTRIFEHELISNGNLSAEEKADLQFLTSGILTKVFVKNGDQVKAGDVIAMIDTFMLANKYRQACEALEKAELDKQESLINLGYKLSALDSVPKDVMHLVCLRSGFNSTKNQYELIKHEYENAFLKSPISGTVVNLFQKPYSLLESGPFCSIISNRKLEVEFSVLENELPLLNLNDKVNIYPYALPHISATGKITNINPIIDKNGMVKVKASVNYQPNLFQGMNVKISILRNAGKQWVIPKTAVVLRTNRPVVFSLSDGKAAWHYVSIGYQNATSYTITSETLQENDIIIITGNENLADRTPVTVKN